ncbi:MAG: hypothetical protein AAGI37_21010 [Planctomycetota bacterium]
MMTYDNTETIADTADEGLGLTTSIGVREHFGHDYANPMAEVKASVGIAWPVTGDEDDMHLLRTHFIATFRARPAMYDDGRSIEKAKQQASRWVDSTVAVQLAARDRHLQTITEDATGTDADFRKC